VSQSGKVLFVLGHDELPTACGWFVGNGRCGIHASLLVGPQRHEDGNRSGFQSLCLLINWCLDYFKMLSI